MTITFASGISLHELQHECQTANCSVNRWPDAWRELDTDLRAGRGSLALVEGAASGVEGLVDAMSVVVDHVVSVGQRFALHEEMLTLSDLLDIPTGSVLLVDIDVLFTPALKLDVLSQLHGLGRGRSLVVLWPGRVHAGRLSYSLPGRQDYVDVSARNVIVLRPTTTQFPDEVPYLLERVPA